MSRSITGVPTEKVKEFAREYANAKSAVIIYCLGITELTTGTDNVRFRWATFRCSPGTSDARAPGSTRSAARTTCRVPAIWARTRTCTPVTRSARSPTSGPAWRKSWGMPAGSLPDWYGVTLTEQINQCGDPDQGDVYPRPQPGRLLPGLEPCQGLA